MLSIKKELKVFRGTYAEVMAQETEDMTIYLAWDTQEIFVGNKYGVKTPYTGGSKFTERQIRDLFELLADEKFDVLQAQVVTINVVSTAAKNAADAVTARLDDLEQDLSDDITERVNELITSGSLASTFYTKAQVDTLVANALLAYYTKANIESFMPTGLTTLTFGEDYDELKSTVSSLEAGSELYASIMVLDDAVITPQQLLAYAQSPQVLPGIYSFRTSEGYEILNKKSDSQSVRLSHDGFAYKLVSGAWQPVADPAMVRRVNNLLPDAQGNVAVNADAIINSGSTYKINSLVPETSNGAVNVLGRAAGDVGNNSVSLGINSRASAESSIAIGNSAVTAGSDSIQLGNSTGSQNTASSNTFSVWQHKLLDRTTGKIPTERITETFSQQQVAIPYTAWSQLEKTASVAVAGLTSTSIVWVSPSETSLTSYSNYGVRAVSQSTNTLVFKCDIVPTSGSLLVDLVWRA